MDIDKVLITGGAGFIGRHLTSKLRELGIQVLAVGRQSDPGDLICDYRQCDLTQSGVLDSLITSSTLVFHLAASANVARSVENPAEDFEQNVLATFHVLESVRKRKARLVFPSTASVYDSSNAMPLTEKSAMRPTSPYGASKLASESYCFAYARTYGLDIRVVRLFSIYGEGMRQLLIHDLVRRIQNNPDQLVLRGDGMQVRDYLHIDDAVDGLWHVATSGAPGEDYNLGSGQPTKIRDIANQVVQLAGRPDLPVVCDRVMPAGDIPIWYADISKIKGLGFSPRITLSEGLQRTVNWLQENPA